MSRPVVARIVYGMGGQLTDPGSHTFTEMVRTAIPGVDLGRSPYRDYEVDEIAGDFIHAPADAVRLGAGASLGCNNQPVIADRVHARAPHILIHGMFGFQASSYGADTPFPSNVLFAHEFYNSLGFMTFWMGNLKWHVAENNHGTDIVLTNEWSTHPGETPKAMNTFIAEMRRIVRRPGDDL